MDRANRAESSSAQTISDEDLWYLYPHWRKEQQEVRNFYTGVNDYVSLLATIAKADNEVSGKEVDVGVWETVGYFTLPSGDDSSALELPIPGKVMDAWYLALSKENCFELSLLLEYYPELAIVRIRGETKSFAIRGDYGRETPRKRWTALHAGCRRGSVVLVSQLMTIFGGPNFQIWWEKRYGKAVDGYRMSDVLRVTLRDLLLHRDEEFNLDALAMAVVSGNGQILEILARSSFRNEDNPYKIKATYRLNDSPLNYEPRGHVEVLDRVRKITKDFIENELSIDIKPAYYASMDFNFLPGLLYCFHFTFSSDGQGYLSGKPIYLLKVARTFCLLLKRLAHETSVNIFNLLKDGQGRTAMHVAVDEGTAGEKMLASIMSDNKSIDLFLSSRDSKGRTLIGRPAATNKAQALTSVMTDYRGARMSRDLVRSKKVKRNVRLEGGEQRSGRSHLGEWSLLMSACGIDTHELSSRNEFEDFHELKQVSPYETISSESAYRADFHNSSYRAVLSEAILFKNTNCVRLLLENADKHCFLHSSLGESKMTFLPLAVVMEDVASVELLLKYEHFFKEGYRGNYDGGEVKAIHFAALHAKYDILSLLLRERKDDHFIEDREGNTALHHVLHYESEWLPKLTDFVNLEHLRGSLEKLRQKKNTKVDFNSIYGGQRRGCVQLLLQYGFDIWATNKRQELPSPGSNAPDDFLSWWYETRTKEIADSQRTLNAAANAISVTAALVATVSYLGPFQPPVGSVDDESERIGLGRALIKTYLSCQTLAFYLAVASVIIALTVAIPLPQQSLTDELKGIRRQVIAAVVLLFPSIIFLVVGFAAASFLTVSDLKFPISAVVVGGVACLLATYFFLVRLVRVVAYRVPLVKKFYKVMLCM